MNSLRFIFIVCLMCLTGCAVDVLQEDALLFFEEDLWDDFEYFDHTPPLRQIDIEFPLADDRN